MDHPSSRSPKRERCQLLPMTTQILQQLHRQNPSLMVTVHPERQVQFFRIFLCNSRDEMRVCQIPANLSDLDLARRFCSHLQRNIRHQPVAAATLISISPPPCHKHNSPLHTLLQLTYILLSQPCFTPTLSQPQLPIDLKLFDAKDLG